MLGVGGATMGIAGHHVKNLKKIITLEKNGLRWAESGG